MGEDDALGAEPDIAVERADRELEVEVRRRHRRTQRRGAGDQHPDGVADQQGARLLVEHRLVVLGVPRRLDQGELVAATEVDPLPVARGQDPRGVDGEHPPVEGVEELAVDPPGAVDETGGVDEVGGALLVDDHGRRGEVGGEIADRTGVVEVDVGEDDPGEIVGTHAEIVEAAAHRLGARPGPGLDEGGPRTLDEEAGGEAVLTPEQGVDLPDPRGDQEGVRHEQPRVPNRAQRGLGLAPGLAEADGLGMTAAPGPTSCCSFLRSAWTASCSLPYVL